MIRYYIGKIHLWLGLVSGLLVFVIALTGCIYAFQEEIQNATQPYRFVVAQPKPLLPPSAILHKSGSYLPNKEVYSIVYQGINKSVKVMYYSYAGKYYYLVYLNPYSGKVLKVKDENRNFFRFIMNGHFYLWLPPQIGQPVVASATLIFFILIISGIVIWWPRNIRNLKQVFTVKWDSGWKRISYDMHKVVGFYISWLALIFVVTGLVWGFIWFRNSYYAVISGGKNFNEYQLPLSDTAAAAAAGKNTIDKVWDFMQNQYPNAESIELRPAADAKLPVAASANPDGGTYWKADYRYFDQHTLKELKVNHLWGRYHNASRADKLMRMNYDIHTGSILGLFGKVVAFTVSLIIASLPITGFLIWRQRAKRMRQMRERG